MKQETIHELLSLAVDAYTANESADKYACNAASKAASDAAKKHSEEYADAAAALAAMRYFKTASQTALFSTNVADSANLKFAHDRSLFAARHTFNHRKTPIRKNIHADYTDIVNPIDERIHAADEELHSNYQAAFSNDPTTNQKAIRAASYVYSHTYATARHAYILSAFDANKYQDPSKREQAFKTSMTQKLSDGLSYDQIQSSLLLQMMCSVALCVIAGALIVGGAAVIVCATYGVGSIPFAIGIASGSLSAATGTGLLIGGFFARREQQQINEANERIEETNAIF